MSHAEIWFDPENHASRAVAQALGFAPAGTRLITRADGSRARCTCTVWKIRGCSARRM